MEVVEDARRGSHQEDSRHTMSIDHGGNKRKIRAEKLFVLLAVLRAVVVVSHILIFSAPVETRPRDNDQETRRTRHQPRSTDSSDHFIFPQTLLHLNSLSRIAFFLRQTSNCFSRSFEGRSFEAPYTFPFPPIPEEPMQRRENFLGVCGCSTWEDLLNEFCQTGDMSVCVCSSRSLSFQSGSSWNFV